MSAAEIIEIFDHVVLVLIGLFIAAVCLGMFDKN